MYAVGLAVLALSTTDVAFPQDALPVIRLSPGQR
jgi:hypothetical protein